jgi:GDPmannose 4,6-dehydratase
MWMGSKPPETATHFSETVFVFFMIRKYALRLLDTQEGFLAEYIRHSYHALVKTMKKALITGITGQDGSYLTEFLLEKGYEVHGIIRRSSSFNTGRIEHHLPIKHKNGARLLLHYGDLSDGSSLNRILEKVRPDEIYHLGAQSHVRVSFDIPEYTADVDALGTLRMLDAIRETGIKTKFYQASSSEMFGKVAETPQKETTPFHPRSPYGCAKVFGYWIARNYRESYGLYAVNGILFNHESPRRGETFVTRKVTAGLSRVKRGLQETVQLGNLDAKRDWGYAKDYVEGMWRMLQQKEPDDYILATGETHSIRELVEEAGKLLGFEITWKDKGLKEKGIDKKTGKTIIEIDPKYYRPAEVDLLLGDATKARKKLGWKPKVKFKELIKIMVEADLALIDNKA